MRNNNRWPFFGRMGVLLLCVSGSPPAGWAAHVAGSYPKLMTMSIGGQSQYTNSAVQSGIAKFDVAIMGFTVGWNGDVNGSKISPYVQQLKQMNSHILVGQYTILTDAYAPGFKWADDKTAELTAMNWWLLDAAGNYTTWTTQYGTDDTNITTYTVTDANGMRYSEWLANRDYQKYFSVVPGFDIWYHDNVDSQDMVATADWKRMGTNQKDTDPDILAAYRDGQRREWAAGRQLLARLLHMGNTTSTSDISPYKGLLNGVFLEALMGLSWSIETTGGWGPMMQKYRNAMSNTAAPQLVGFAVDGTSTTYQFLRYALGSCLMDNGYFSYSDDSAGYGGVPIWFDEYDQDLGQPVDPPQTSAWQNGVYFRRFTKGAALVNPTSAAVTVTVPAGYKRFVGSQDPVTNNGRAAGTLTLQSKDGLILLTNSPPAPPRQLRAR